MPKSRFVQIAALAAAGLAPGLSAQSSQNPLQDNDTIVEPSIDEVGMARELVGKVGTDTAKQHFIAAIRDSSGNEESLSLVRGMLGGRFINLKDDRTPGGNPILSIAVRKGDTEMAGILLGFGANPNDKVKITGHKNPMSLLDLAVLQGDDEMAGTLMKSGAAMSEKTRKLLQDVARDGAANPTPDRSKFAEGEAGDKDFFKARGAYEQKSAQNVSRMTDTKDIKVGLTPEKASAILESADNAAADIALAKPAFTLPAGFSEKDHAIMANVQTQLAGVVEGKGSSSTPVAKAPGKGQASQLG